MLSHLCIIFVCVTRFVTKHKDIYVTAAKLRVDFQYVGKTFVQNVLSWLLSFCLLTSSQFIYTVCFKYICNPTSVSICQFDQFVCHDVCVSQEGELEMRQESGHVLINRILWKTTRPSRELRDCICQRESTWLMMHGLSIKNTLFGVEALGFSKKRALEDIKKADIYLTFITECEGTRVLMLRKKTSLYCVAETSTEVSMLAI